MDLINPNILKLLRKHPMVIDCPFAIAFAIPKIAFFRTFDFFPVILTLFSIGMIVKSAQISTEI